MVRIKVSIETTNSFARQMLLNKIESMIKKDYQVTSSVSTEESSANSFPVLNLEMILNVPENTQETLKENLETELYRLAEASGGKLLHGEVIAKESANKIATLITELITEKLEKKDDF